MNNLYNIVLNIFDVFSPFFSFFSKKIKIFFSVRKNLLKKIEDCLKNDNSEKVWFHAASLGEFEQGRPIIENFKELNPNVKIILTFFSPSGYEIQKNYKNADYVFYLPLDTRKNAKKFIQLINPKFAVFIKYEYWWNYFKTLNINNIPLYCVSNIFRQNSSFFKWYGHSYRKILNNVTHFFVQNKESETLLNSIGLHNVSVSGDTRFDRVLQIANNSKNIEIAEKFIENCSRCIVAGSTWKPDEEILCQFVNNSDVKIIIAPHKINNENILRIKKLFTKKTICYSEINNDTQLSDYQVLIIDNIGLLSSLYKYGQIAYIGGGFGVGIHNTLEAANYGMPIFFGPNYKKFAEAIDLINIKSAFTINNTNDFTEKINELWQNHEKLNIASSNSRKYVIEKSGATKIILEKITHFF